MNWFIIVIMTQQLNAFGKPEMPLWIPEMVFEGKEECMTFARNNQLRLFRKSTEAYGGSILPTRLNCVNEDIMVQIGQLKSEEGKKNEENI